MSSRLTNRKLVQAVARKTQHFDTQLDIENMPPTQRLARVIVPRGQNLFECEWIDLLSIKSTDSTRDAIPTDTYDPILLEMPPKYRNVLWIKRGRISLCLCL